VVGDQWPVLRVSSLTFIEKILHCLWITPVWAGLRARPGWPGNAQLTGSATIYLMVAQGVWHVFRINDTNPSAICSCGP